MVFKAANAMASPAFNIALWAISVLPCAVICQVWAAVPRVAVAVVHIAVGIT